MFYDCFNLTTTINITGNIENYSYTFKTSSLVDNIIATKSSTSNVVNGVQI